MNRDALALDAQAVTNAVRYVQICWVGVVLGAAAFGIALSMYPDSFDNRYLATAILILGFPAGIVQLALLWQVAAEWRWKVLLLLPLVYWPIAFLIVVFLLVPLFYLAHRTYFILMARRWQRARGDV